MVNKIERTSARFFKGYPIWEDELDKCGFNDVQSRTMAGIKINL